MAGLVEATPSALAVFVVAFLASYFALRERPMGYRVKTASSIGALIAAGQLVRQVVPGLSEPPVSTILGAGLVAVIVLGLAIGAWQVFRQKTDA